MWNISVSLYSITSPEVYVVISICGIAKMHKFGLPTIQFHVSEYFCHSCGRLCDLVVRVPGYRTEMYEYCISCEVRTEFIYVM
jgi:hypothetical protein